MAGLPEYKLANLNKSQLRSRRLALEQFLNGYRSQPPVAPGPDRDRAQAALDAIDAELATPARQAEWPK